MSTETSPAMAIKKVMYTASLASEPAAVDEIMDKVRMITARINQPEDMTPQDLADINTVQQNLEAYLISQEKLRTFTSESLGLQIEQHMQGGSVSSRTQWQLGGIILFVVAAAITVTQLPGAPRDPFLLTRLVGFTAVAGFHLGAAWLFLSALSSFKSELRRAFIVLCTGIILLGLALLEQPLIELFSLRDWSFIGIFISLPLAIASAVFFAGIYYYARTVGVRSSLWPILPAAALIGLISFLTPHIKVSDPELIYDLAATFQGWVVIFPILSFFLLNKIVERLAEVYKPPAQALKQTMIVIILVTVWVYAIRLIVGSNFLGVPAVIGLVLLILEGVFLVRAGYSFNKISRY